MDIQSFIQSGLLESYSLGLCTPSERTLVEEMLAQYPEARTELASIEQALEQYANAQSVTPPPELKERILREIDQISLPPAGGNTMLRLLMAAVVGLILLSAYLWYQMSQAETSRINTQREVAQLQQQLIDCGTSNDQAREIVNIVRNPETKAFKMGNETDSPAFVFQNVSPAQCVALLDVSALPVQPAGKYLQFWAIVDGVPVSMGMVKADSNGFQSFPCVANVAAFAISIEDKPEGNPVPTVVLMAG